MSRLKMATAVNRTSRREAILMPQGLLSLGMDRRPTPEHRTGWGPASPRALEIVAHEAKAAGPRVAQRPPAACPASQIREERESRAT